ncbi:MAG: transposase family protein, partial [Candidatus Omnitrophica bacterium]|nr:transposase family protein [Candidatus Omnitrophota bacterium]
VFQGLDKIIKQFPFPVVGIDSDNGSEFINSHLTRYCEQNRITFTRARPYRKNDNCYVEQKNWHIVRKSVGYWRYQTEKEVEIMNELYKALRLYTNFFQPQLKLIEKSRVGSKIVKKYDKARTPYQRIINCADVDESIKKELKLQYQCLNVVELKTKIIRLQNILYRAVRNNPYYRRLRESKKEKKEYVLG